VIGEPLGGPARLGGKLMRCRIIDRSGRDRDLLNATQEGTCLSQERLGLLGCLRGSSVWVLVGGGLVGHGASIPFPVAAGGLDQLEMLAKGLTAEAST
jgi:hypothetical protein